MSKLSWSNLLSEARRKDREQSPKPKNQSATAKRKPGQKISTAGFRTESERDFDRILFASPTRRLADKTQVFPLDPSDSVRTRLTHSHEVSNLARSVGMSLAFNYPKEVFGARHEKLNVKRRVPAILAAIGLAHDLGNPPFGHQGEKAMRHWFSHIQQTCESMTVHSDFLNFDGNPQTFRLLTRLQILNDDFGLNLTDGTLAALIKYPRFSTNLSGEDEKFGIFESERSIVESVWKSTGLAENVRHPFAYIMEACDDIAYAVLDAEDTVKKGYASFSDLMDFLSAGKSKAVKNVCNQAKKKNKSFKKEELSSYELNEVSMQMFRVYAIHEMVVAITDTFVANVGVFMKGGADMHWELVENSDSSELCKLLKDFDKRHGFRNKQVLELELLGENNIGESMDMFWDAIRYKDKPFSRYATALISENYRRVRNANDGNADYADMQLLSDSTSGMTDSYLLKTNAKLRKLYHHGA